VPGGYGRPPATAPNGAPLADFGQRLLARLIDGLIVGGVSMVVFVPLIVVYVISSVGSVEVADDGTVTGADAGSQIGLLLLLEFGLFVFSLIIQYGYDVELTKNTGQTFGKRIMKLRVVPMDPSQAINRGTMAKRWLVIGPGGLVPGLGLINGLWQLWDQPYKQCLHDKFARTVVVRVPG
jgi:uncharacterized RDD family membrane protein YckC